MNDKVIPSPAILDVAKEDLDFSGAVSLQYSSYGSQTLKRDMYVVTRGFVYDHKIGELKCSIFVPLGFLTDIASIPRAFWMFIPPEGQYGQAAVLHDYLCEYMQVIVDGKVVSITRAQVDSILNEAMLDLGVPTFKRWCIYNAVRLYRITCRVSKPSFDPAKLKIEDEMREIYAECEQFP